MDVPGIGMDGGDPMMRALLGSGNAAQGRVDKLESDVGASRERETAARAAQAEALKPKRDELQAKLGQVPTLPAMASAGKPPEAPKIDTKEMGETLSLITALAAIGGALTRQPLTAALNNFSAGVHGMVQGKQMVFQDQLKEFDANLKKAHADNTATWQQYQAARDKYKTDIAGLQNELKLIAAETNDPIALEMAKRGDILSIFKVREKANSDFDKVIASVGKMRETHEAHAEAVRHHKETEAAARERETRLAAVKGDPKQQDKLTKEYQALARRAHGAMLKAWDKAKDDVARAEIKRRYDEEMATLDAEMRSRGFAGTLNGKGGSAPAASPSAAPAQAAAVKSFATPEEADAAAKRGELQPGARISIGGQTGTWQ